MKAWRRASLAGASVAAGAGVLMAVPVFACTEAPSIQLNQLSAAAGSDVVLTGAAWANLPISVHWDGLSGAVLATVTPVGNQGVLPPVTIHIPSTAEPGYHFLVATDNLFSADTARSGFQVTSTNGVGAPPPQAILTGPAGNQSPSTVGVGVIALLAALGGSGLVVSTVGAVGLARSRRTATAVNVTRPPRRR